MIAVILRFFEKLIWRWRLWGLMRHLRCTRCEGSLDQITVDLDKETRFAHRITAHCSACNHWDDWRR